MTQRRRTRRGCVAEAHHGHLRLRFRWRGQRRAKTLALTATPENQAQADRLAGIVAAYIQAGRDPLPLLAGTPKETGGSGGGPTVAAYYATWIRDKHPPLVRKAQARDYRRHMGGYVLPRLGPIPLAEFTARDLLGLRTELLARGLSLKYVKNILAGSFKAMIRDARDVDQLLDRDPFVGVRWGRVPVPPPDPFSFDERQRILDWFKRKAFGFHAGRATQGPRVHPHPPYHVFVHFLFWTGTRPSEAAGLRWSDVDLDAGVVRVVRSRHLWEDSAPKTAQAARTVELLPETVRLLAETQPRRVTPETPVFPNTRGRPLEPNSFLKPWYAGLRALGIRQRGLYAMKDTYISTAMTAGVNTAWLEAQTGVRYETLKRHYGKWLRTEGADQLEKLARLAPRSAPKRRRRAQVPDFTRLDKCERGDLNPHAAAEISRPFRGALLRRVAPFSPGWPLGANRRARHTEEGTTSRPVVAGIPVSCTPRRPPASVEPRLGDLRTPCANAWTMPGAGTDRVACRARVTMGE